MLFIYAWHKDLQPTRIMIVNVDRPFNVYQNKDKQEMSRKVNFCWNQFSNCNEDIVRGNSGDGAVTGWDQRLCSSIKKSLRQDYLMYCAHERRTDYKCLSLIAIFMRYKLPVAVQGIYFKVQLSGRRGGLMVSALISGSSGPGSSPDWRHCVVFLCKTLYSHNASLHPGV